MLNLLEYLQKINKKLLKQHFWGLVKNKALNHPHLSVPLNSLNFVVRNRVSFVPSVLLLSSKVTTAPNIDVT
jgi:hypothetical protein